MSEDNDEPVGEEKPVVPIKQVLQLWAKQPTDTLLGKVQIQADPTGRNNVFISLNPQIMGDTSSATIPETFQVSEQAMPSAMKVISEDIQGLNIVLLKITSGNVSVVGSVDKKVDLKALDDQRLQNSVRTITGKIHDQQKDPQVKIHDPDAVKDKHFRVFSNTLTGQKRPRDERGVVERRERTEEGQLRGLIFQLFTERENWTLKEMNDKLQQPEKHLKDVLSKLCDYNKAGRLRATYSLKAEYSVGPKKEPEEPEKRPEKKFKLNDDLDDDE